MKLIIDLKITNIKKMGVYNFFSRISKNEEYIIHESKVYDIVEVDYGKIRKYKVGSTISFRHTSILNYLMNHKFKGDWGIYHLDYFSFLFNAVNREYKISYRETKDISYAVVFLPEKIKFVVDIIINDLSTFAIATNADEHEIENMKQLKAMLDEALIAQDYILSEIE